MLLEGKVAIVSGIGPGLGRSIAMACAREGADVVLAARTPARLDEVRGEIEGLGRRALSVPTDIAEDADCKALADAAMEAFGRIDALFNNAFVMPPFQSLVDQPIDTIRKSFEVNLYGALRTCQAVIPHMAKSGGGSIVMTNSSVLRKGRPAFGAYKMAKHALLGMARNLAVEVGPMGVRVNSIAPGFIGARAADLLSQIEAPGRGVPAEQIKAEILESHMLRRIPEPDDIADVAIFLASDLARAVTGQCVDVNAGEFTH